MPIIRRILIVLSFLLAFQNVVRADDDLPVVETIGDRTIIYPQRMALSGEETLMDILEMFPDLLVAGFDDLLNGESHFDSWQLRMDNVAMSGDIRLLLTQIKASLISKIQICDNAGVAKGRTGDGRVIDVNLLRAEEGTHGFASMQGGTDKLLAPSANIRYGSEKTDVWTAMTYTRNDRFGRVDNVENFHLEVINRFGKRDRLLTYITQSASVSDAGEEGYSRHGHNESVMARLRYFHTFNDKGTELLALLSWQYKNNPTEMLQAGNQSYRRVTSFTNTPIWLMELNTPLFTKNLTMMLGYEGDFDNTRYGIDQHPVENASFSEESTHRVMNNDLYLQFNYVTGPLRLTIGDRVMFYHYGQDGYEGNWLKNTIRNHFQTSVIVTPCKHHQLQAAYYRKFRNPSAINMFPEAWPDAEGVLIGGNPNLEETTIDQYKVTYGYSRQSFSAKLGGNIYHSSADEDYWTIDGAVYKRFGMLSLTGGFNIYSYRSPVVARSIYADVRLSTMLQLPANWQVTSRLIWFSHRETAFYGALQVNKQFGSHWDVQLAWHDMFSDKRSAGLLGVMYRF